MKEPIMKSFFIDSLSLYRLEEEERHRQEEEERHRQEEERLR